jgi:hypothetical protein
LSVQHNNVITNKLHLSINSGSLLHVSAIMYSHPPGSTNIRLYYKAHTELSQGIVGYKCCANPACVLAYIGPPQE